MPKFTGVPEVAMNLVGGSITYQIKIGDVLDSVTVSGPFGNVMYNAVEVVGMSLATARSANRFGKILDGVPTSHFKTDDMAVIRNAADYFHVDKIALKDAEGIFSLAVNQIIAISGEMSAPDGSKIVSVEITDPEMSVADLFTEEVKTVVIGEGEIAAATTLTTAATVLGVNAGVAQNFAQEV